MSQGAAGRSAQCHMLFARAGTASLVGRTPWSARDALVPLFSGEEPAGGPAADQGIGVKISRRTPPYVVDGRNRVSKILRSGRHILTPIPWSAAGPLAGSRVEQAFSPANRLLARISHRLSRATAWRMHSCVPRRHFCRRLVSTLCHYSKHVSRRVSTRHARVRAPRPRAACEKCGLDGVKTAEIAAVLSLRLSRRLTQTVKTLFPSNDKCFLPIRQQFYAGIVGKAEAGNAGEQPAKE